MPACASASAIASWTPRSLTAPCDETEAPRISPVSSSTTALPVVDPKSMPSTNWRGRSGEVMVGSSPRPLGVDLLQHRFDAAVHDLVGVEGLIDHVALEHRRRNAEL